jgi:hypothetical protein
MQIQNSMKRSVPISLSRWTDVAHWYMPWLKDAMLNKKLLFAPDPQQIILTAWETHPDAIHSLFFWTKYPPKLTAALQDWLEPYRVFTAVTITGWEEVERRVPPLQEQLDAFDAHLDLVGPSYMGWRYSPVPCDFAYSTERQETFARLCEFMSVRGMDTVDVSLLQPSPHWSKGYAQSAEHDETLARQQVYNLLVSIASENGIRIGVCADDIALQASLRPELLKHSYSTACLSRAKLDTLFGLSTPEILENGCACQLSIDPCQGPQFGCASGCQYCYVPFTKVQK